MIYMYVHVSLAATTTRESMPFSRKTTHIDVRVHNLMQPDLHMHLSSFADKRTRRNPFNIAGSKGLIFVSTFIARIHTYRHLYFHTHACFVHYSVITPCMWLNRQPTFG
jgi:hypothetical protein